MAYAIVEVDGDGDKFYLNHSCMSSLSFGSEDMAWTTNDKEKADLMLFKVEKKRGGADSEYDIEEIW